MLLPMLERQFILIFRDFFGRFAESGGINQGNVWLFPAEQLGNRKESGVSDICLQRFIKAWAVVR